MWSGVRDRWASNPTAPDPDRWMPEEPVEVDRAEPTDGRHAFDRDAALTPIFTSLRRTTARRPRGLPPPPPAGPDPARPAPARGRPVEMGGLGAVPARRPVPDGRIPRCSR